MLQNQRYHFLFICFFLLLVSFSLLMTDRANEDCYNTEWQWKPEQKKCNVAFHSSTMHSMCSVHVYIQIERAVPQNKCIRSQWRDVRERYSILWINTYFSDASEIIIIIILMEKTLCRFFFSARKAGIQVCSCRYVVGVRNKKKRKEQTIRLILWALEEEAAAAAAT